MAEAHSAWTLNKPDACPSPIPTSTHIDPADDRSNVQADQDLSKTRILRLHGTQLAAGRSSVGHGDWVDVLENGERELLKRVVRAGVSQSTGPIPGSRVKVRIEGRLPSGEIVDQCTTYFTVGDGDVIQAIDIVTGKMEVGEVCQVKTTQFFAYGGKGRSPDIPPNTSILYELELLEVKEPIDFSSVSESELISQLNRKQAKGEEFFQQGLYRLAVNTFDRAIQMINSYQEEQGIQELSPDVRDQWIRCLNNLAAAQYEVEKYSDVLVSTQLVLQTDPDNAKALYYSGKVLLLQGERDDGIRQLQMAAELSPDDSTIQLELTALRKQEEAPSQPPSQPPSTTAASSWGWTLVLLVTVIGMACYIIKLKK